MKLELSDVWKKFGANVVCKGIDLSVSEGEMVCLIGASGSGKSTLLRCINLLEPVDDGHIHLDGLDITDPELDPQPIRQRIGLVFQSYNLFPHMNALENVILAPRRIGRKSRAELRPMAEALFERFNLADRMGHYPDQLSGGQQQRVAIIRALAMKPEVMLFDEVTSALDPELVGEVLDVLRAGKAILHKLTIPEGLSTVQALERIRAHEALSGEITVQPEEGTLLPDTYLFTRGKARDAIVRQMMQAQRKLLAELWPKRKEGLPLKSPREAVILASIVEKETGVPEERRRIAAVFLNRLKKNMPLQADPTVIYGITKGRPLGRPLTKKDLRAKTPWNTYVIKGLPPTPIANPGRAAIAAVLDPLETDELYFVADGSGRHLFAADLKTHNANVRKLRKIERQRAKARAEKTAAEAAGKAAPAQRAAGEAAAEN